MEKEIQVKDSAKYTEIYHKGLLKKWNKNIVFEIKTLSGSWKRGRGCIFWVGIFWGDFPTFLTRKRWFCMGKTLPPSQKRGLEKCP